MAKSEWSPLERQLFDQAFDDAPNEAMRDEFVEALYHAGWYQFDGLSSDERVAIREALANYLEDEYGIIFDDIFDWEAWRNAYGSGEM